MENCLSAYAVDYGKLRHDRGIWQKGGGKLEMKNCTEWGSRLGLSIEEASEEKPTGVKLDHCVIVPSPGGSALTKGSGIHIAGEESCLLGESAARLQNPSPAWRGGDDAFDCATKPDIGYHFPSRNGGRTARQ
jgi:hypothetical protein